MFIDLAHKFQSGKIIVFPMASGVPNEVGPEQTEQFRRYGARSVAYHILSREQALDAKSMKLLDDIGGVFFSGGVQSRLTDVLSDTPLLAKLHEFYEKGGTIGGTSAGAAVLSQIMITGDEKREVGEGQAFETIQAGNIITVKGFGFLKSAIIDQHFVRRKRHNRLISLVFENPNILGVGIDESTAIIVYHDQTFEVFGENTVMVFDARNLQNVDKDDNLNLSATQISLHILKSGDNFDLKTARVIQ